MHSLYLMGEERVQDFGLLLVVVSKDLFGFPPCRESTLASLIKPPVFILIASRACFSLRSTTNLAAPCCTPKLSLP